MLVPEVNKITYCRYGQLIWLEGHSERAAFGVIWCY